MDNTGIWNDEQDLSGAVSVAWTPEALFVAVKIIDDTHYHSPGESWTSDNVLISAAIAGTRDLADVSQTELVTVECIAHPDGTQTTTRGYRYTNGDSDSRECPGSVEGESGFASECSATLTGVNANVIYEFRVPAKG